MKNGSGLLGGSGGMVEELLTLKEMGLLDGDKSNDSLTRIITLMSLQNNSYMDESKKYVKASKRDGRGRDSGDGGGRKNRGGGNNLIGMLEGFQSITITQVFGAVETFLTGVEAGPDLNQVASGYSLSNWGNTPTNDVKVIKYLLNTVAAMANAVKVESAAERTEASYALLDAFDGEKTWGNSGNLSGILPLALLGGGGLGGLFGGGSSTFALPPPRFT